MHSQVLIRVLPKCDNPGLNFFTASVSHVCTFPLSQGGLQVQVLGIQPRKICLNPIFQCSQVYEVCIDENVESFEQVLLKGYQVSKLQLCFLKDTSKLWKRSFSLIFFQVGCSRFIRKQQLTLNHFLYDLLVNCKFNLSQFHKISCEICWVLSAAFLLESFCFEVHTCYMGTSIILHDVPIS